MNFLTQILSLGAIISFLGVQSDFGKDLFKDFGKRFNKKIKNTESCRIAIFSLFITTILSMVLFAGTPFAARLFRQQGVNYLDNGNYSKSIVAFQRALQLTQGDSRTYYNLANAEEELHYYADAITHYQKSIELDDSFWLAYNNLGRLLILATNDPDIALATLFTGRLKSDDNLGQAILSKNIGWAYYKKGYFEKALEELDKSVFDLNQIQNEGTNVDYYLADAYRLKSQVHISLKEFDEAIIELQNSYAYAISILESSLCLQNKSSISVDCIDALLWINEAEEILVDLKGE